MSRAGGAENLSESKFVRPTCVCVHEDGLLLVKQVFKDMGEMWSLPGGAQEGGETIEEAMVRETKDETGVTVRMKRLLYVSERFLRAHNKRVIHIMLESEYVSGEPGVGVTPTTNEKIEAVKFVPIGELEDYGVSTEFSSRVRAGFPDAGSYYPNIEDLGL